MVVKVSDSYESDENSFTNRLLQNVTVSLMEQLVHWIRVTVRPDNVLANLQFVDEAVMTAKTDRLIYLVVVYSVAKIVDVTSVVLSIRFVTKELVNVNVIPG